MTDTNPRDLIRRLTTKLDLLHCQYNVPSQSALIYEAYAFLDQLEPEGPLGSPMTDQHPITPPPELVRHWSRFQGDTHPEALWFRIANEAAQWGADQELKACCDWLRHEYGYGADLAFKLRATRRPKPLSLKKQACDALDAYIYGNPDHNDKQNTYNAIRRALEALPDER